VRSVILGTAGHIDHGKSALVEALTGTHPDRLTEERERGITIDLGFAHLDLGDVRVAFVDVPGHERFVRNMLAGVHGIDAVLLAVAADESVMPQTREHFEICRLLGIPGGIVALTKCDVADPELQELCRREILELTAGSFLEGAPLVRCSARTGQGLDELRRQLSELRREDRGERERGPLRLPVDRVFTMRGFGTVVTGTLVSGRVETGEELELLPSGRKTRARGIQAQGQPVGCAVAGQRTALNLAGLEVGEVRRGEVVARPGTLRASSVMDAEIELLGDARPLRDRARVRVHMGSGEWLARVRLADGGTLPPGASGLAQLRLERPGVAAWNDRVVLRSYSPLATIGGGRILDPLAARRGRIAPEVARGLAAGDRATAASVFLSLAGSRGLDAATLAARLGSTADFARAFAAVSGAVELGGGGLISSEALDRLEEAGRARLAAYHREHPLRHGMPREELRRAAFASAAPGAFELILERAAAAGELVAAGDGVAAAGHAVTLSPDEEAARRALCEAALEAGLQGLDAAALARLGLPAAPRDRVTRLLRSEGVLVGIGGSLVHRESLDQLAARLREGWPPGAPLEVADFKRLTGLTRKHAIPLLEYLDSAGVTRRSGTARKLSPEARAARPR